MSYKQEVPTCKSDVYIHHGVNWMDAARVATELGFKWATRANVIGEGKLGYMVESIDGGTTLYASGIHGQGPIMNYNNLPDEPGPTFESRVLEFVNDPARSDRNGLYAKLAAKRFFTADEKGQRAVIDEMLDSDVFCNVGKQKFRDHMGDMLASNEITFTVTVDAKDARAFADGLDLSEREAYTNAKNRCRDAARDELNKQGL